MKQLIIPGLAQASSFFDRLWQKGRLVKRHFIFVRKAATVGGKVCCTAALTGTRTLDSGTDTHGYVAFSKNCMSDSSTT
eukprot:6236068-Amphidinium_carterae.1